MKYLKSLSILILGAVVVACSTNPFTGKQTLALVPNSQILPMAFQQYEEFLSEH
ncbi:MAG TPA: peptidase M48, partial [Aequorivita sp.]|nr:peptidase M48 [Aequorivita sp.]